jgi:hypothetical protein
MTTEALEYLLAEIREEFEADRVGLYLFPASLVQKYPDMSWRERVDLSGRALRVLLASGEAKLVWELWRDFDGWRDAADITPREGDWEWPSDDPDDVDTPYLGVRPSS